MGRGRKSAVSAKDEFFVVLIGLKNGGKCDFKTRIFNMKGPTVER